MTVAEFVREKINEGWTSTQIRRGIREKFGVKKSQGNRLFRRAIDELASDIQHLQEKISKECALDDFIDYVGINREEWDVRDFSVKNTASGDNLWNVYFKRKEPLGFDKDDFLKHINSPVVRTKFPVRSNTGLLACVSIFDLHLNKLCDPIETGEHYDLEEAKKVFNQAVDFKIKELKKHDISKILFPIGNDFYHAEFNDATTAGTKQDCDKRFFTMFKEGVKLVQSAIDKLKEVAPVDVIVVHGNHGTVAEVMLGEVLDAYYRNDEDVNIENSLLPRKYLKWGKTLLGFAHGDKCKLASLPLLMAQEAADLWSETKYRIFQTGHLHTQRSIISEYAGVVVEIIPSLAGSDAWHTKNGYVGNTKTAITSLFHKEHGLVNKIFFNL